MEDEKMMKRRWGTKGQRIFALLHIILRHYPEMKQRLRQEFDRVLGSDLSRPITYKDLNELEYCVAVTREIYRHSLITFLLDVEEEGIPHIGSPTQHHPI
ncbi:hypothetical protein C1646_811031 [Rhizophagus diaphanus]|nr:hypothetical protein C1646_811031 [Rhizophagus diaphanus] [Rhizophagus sp. MUCL 43196]